jgi:2-polyprenyl-3-methyl-5-hydroxy-6-metoxy-1,4-benzoquinol methylase
MTEIKPIAMPGTHESFFKYFQEQNKSKKLKVLDLGAGHGAFTKRLYDLGYNIEACDLFPEIFHFDKIKCEKVNITSDFPYEDACFDLVIAVEVSEHILDHEVFFKEINRILKPGGELMLSTPNILSLKSRMVFLLRGFYYSFGPLEMDRHDGLQHIASMTLDQYNYVALKHGFQEAEYEIDRLQSTSRWILLFISPIMWVNNLRKKVSRIHNSRKLMLGRLLFLKFKK